MTTEQSKAVTSTQEQTKPLTQQEQPALRPAVDVHENDDVIVLYAELPGVSQNNLNITIDNGSLQLEAKASINTQPEMNVVYAEFQTANYRRSFTLSNELDIENIEAKLSHGILQLIIPKKETIKPKKVEVKVA